MAIYLFNDIYLCHLFDGEGNGGGGFFNGFHIIQRQFTTLA